MRSVLSTSPEKTRTPSTFPLVITGVLAKRAGYTAAMRAFDIEVDDTMPEHGDRLEALTYDLLSIVQEVHAEMNKRSGRGLSCVVHSPRRPLLCPVCALIEARTHKCHTKGKQR